MTKCPNCNELTITNLQKMNLSPLSEIECPNCKNSITMTWIVMLYKLLYMALMIICIFQFEMELTEFVIVLVITIILDNVTRLKFVPLIIKK